MHELRRIFGDILCGNKLSLKGLQTYFHVTVEKYILLQHSRKSFFIRLRVPIVQV